MKLPRWMKFGKSARRAVQDGRTRSRDWQAAGEYDALREWTTSDVGTINALLISAGDKLRARARWAQRNSPMVARYLDVAKRNIVGYQFTYKNKQNARGDKRFENGLEAHKMLLQQQSKPNNFTVTGALTRGEAENLILEHVIRDGEALVQRVRRFGSNDTGYALRIIDPNRIATYLTTGRAHTINGARADERIIGGVGVDENYRPLAYYIYDDSKTASTANILAIGSQIIRVPATDMLHIFKKQHTNQLRGISWLATVLFKAEVLRRYEDTAMQAARSGAAKHLTVHTQRGNSYRGERKENEELQVSMDGSDLTVLNSGEQFIFHDPKYPHEMFKEFINTIKQDIASGLDSTPPVLTGDYAGINFSAGQLLSLEDRHKWENHQQWYADIFMRWWHEDWLAWAMMKGMLRSVGGGAVSPTIIQRLTDCDWIGKKFAPIDPKKAAEAASIRIASGVSSIANEIRMRGDVPEEMFDEIDDEKDRGYSHNPQNGGIMQPNTQTNGDEE